MKYDAIIFDVDGVLIDASKSFGRAAIEAVAYETGSDRFGMAEIAQLKSVPGFNDDFHVAIAGAIWQTHYNTVDFGDFVEAINNHGSGMPGLRGFAGEKNDPAFEMRVARLAMESYGGTTRCDALYGFVPSNIIGPGAWKSEIGLLSLEQIAPILDICGIVTGRSAVELDLAFEILGWSLPNIRITTADSPELLKPNPAAIKPVISALDCNKPLYVGDTHDDLALVVNARGEGIDCDYCHISKVDKAWDGIDIKVKSVTDLLDVLEV